MNTKIILLSLISGLSTVVGCFILFFGKKYKKKVLSFSFGLSATVMFFISVLELIPEAINYAFNVFSIPILFIVSLCLLMMGGVVVKVLDRSKDDSLYHVGFLCMLSVLIHNIPEGIITALSLVSNYEFGLKMFLIIMIHNIPEGISIAAPIYYSGHGKLKSLLYSMVSGGGEVLGAILGILLFRYFNVSLLMYVLLMITAGIMIYLSLKKLFLSGIKTGNIKYFIFGIISGLLVLFISL